MIKPREFQYGKPKDRPLTERELKAFILIIRDNPFTCQGLARYDTPLYKTIYQMRKDGFVRREGFRYYPTRYGYIAFLKTPQQPNNPPLVKQNQQTLLLEEAQHEI